jgi:ubiquinone/menaquinone biosynthesis C-methylase UbiE
MSFPMTANPYQYEDLLVRSRDLYANTKYQILLDHLRGFHDLSILNAGCGAGDLSLDLAALGHRVLGIDLSTDYIRLARGNAATAGVENCSFLVSSIEDFHTDEEFDCVVATDVLEHIEDDKAAWDKLVRLVKPGGMLLITVPAGQWLFGFHDEALGHYRRYSHQQLARLIAQSCRIDALRYFGFSLIPVCYLYSKWLRKPYPVGASGDSAKNPLLAFTLRWLLSLDRHLPLPFGTSLILKATREVATRPMRAFQSGRQSDTSTTGSLRQRQPAAQSATV